MVEGTARGEAESGAVQGPSPGTACTSEMAKAPLTPDDCRDLKAS